MNEYHKINSLCLSVQVGELRKMLSDWFRRITTNEVSGQQ